MKLNIELLLNFISFDVQQPELGRIIICLREMGENNHVEVETCEVDDSFITFREWNSYTHWCYLPIIKT